MTEQKNIMSAQALSLGELFSLTWAQYKQRALPIIAIILISSVLIGGLVMVMVLCGLFGGAILTHVMDKPTSFSIIAALLTLLPLIITILMIWCQAALLAIVVDEGIGIIEAFQKGWEYLWPLTWIVTILSGILMTGFALGFLPGFLFLVWFSFCAFIMFEEDRRGMESLLLSKEYVRGFGWNTCGKMIVIWLLSIMAGFIPFIGQILSILFAPFLMLYLLNMYRDLKSIKGTITLENNTGMTVFWWTVTIIGLLLPLVVLVALLSLFFSGDQHWMMPAWEEMHGTRL